MTDTLPAQSIQQYCKIKQLFTASSITAAESFIGVGSAGVGDQRCTADCQRRRLQGQECAQEVWSPSCHSEFNFCAVALVYEFLVDRYFLASCTPVQGETTSNEYCCIDCHTKALYLNLCEFVLSWYFGTREHLTPLPHNPTILIYC